MREETLTSSNTAICGRCGRPVQVANCCAATAANSFAGWRAAPHPDPRRSPRHIAQPRSTRTEAARDSHMDHIPDDLIDEYALGRLGEPELAALEEHLLACGECRNRLQLADEFIQALREARRKAKTAG